MKNVKKEVAGFTLIELLVVIAIIGILASIAMVNLGSARLKGVDAKIKGEATSARSQAELFYAGNSTFAGVCTAVAASNGLAAIKADLSANSASVTCQSSAAAWVLQAQLKSTTGYFCVDSSGSATTSATSLISSGTDYAC